MGWPTKTLGAARLPQRDGVIGTSSAEPTTMTRVAEAATKALHGVSPHSWLADETKQVCA